MKEKQSLKLVIGIVFILFVIPAIEISGFAVIVFIIASIVCIPQSLDLLEKNLKKTLPRKLKYIIVISCLIAGFLAIYSEKVTVIKEVKKLSHQQEKQAPIYKIDPNDDVKQNPKSYLELRVIGWENAAFGTVGVYNLNIKNTSNLPIQDIVLKFTYYGESGTILNTNEATIYKIIKPKSTLKERNFNAGFKHSQGVTCNVEIIGAVAKVLYN